MLNANPLNVIPNYLNILLQLPYHDLQIILGPPYRHPVPGRRLEEVRRWLGFFLLFGFGLLRGDHFGQMVGGLIRNGHPSATISPQGQRVKEIA